MRTSIGATLAIVLACGCTDLSSTPTDPGTGSAAFVVAGNSGCYTVNFRTALSPTAFPTFTGPVTGDLQGTIELTFDLPFVVNGKKAFGSGPVTWNITGGIVPGVPFTFRTASSALTLFLNDNDPLLLETHGTEKALDGVRLANFTSHGVTDISGAQVTVLDYRGVICP